MTRKTALLIADGRAGHQRIVLGILKSLSRIENIDPCWVSIAEIGKPHRTMQRMKAWIGVQFDKLSYRINASSDDIEPRIPTIYNLNDIKDIDYVIGAGPRSAAPVIAMSKQFNAKSIFFGNPRIPFLKEFDILIRFKNSYFVGSPIITHIRPHNIEIRPLSKIPNSTRDCQSVTVLMGGNKHWTNIVVSEFLENIFTQFKNVKIEVFNSRRTPIEISDEIHNLIRSLKESQNIAFYDFRERGFSSNSFAYENNIIFVTADSMSMLSEAVSAQRPVIVIIPQGYNIPQADRIELDYFKSRNHVVIWDLNLESEPIPDISNIEIMSENHIESLSTKIYQKLYGQGASALSSS